MSIFQFYTWDKMPVYLRTLTPNVIILTTGTPAHHL